MGIRSDSLNIVAIVQARMASSRLPGKVLHSIAGKPMLAHVIDRVCQAESINEAVIATSVDPLDDEIERFCKKFNYICFRGSHHDVLDRYYKAAHKFNADVIVRITGDCPLIDPQVVEKTVQALLGKYAEINSSLIKGTCEDRIPFDFAANRLPPPWKRTYPVGLDTEVCTFEVLKRAWKEADQPHQREHVMPYLYEVKGRFQTIVVNYKDDYSWLRLTVDTEEDLEFMRKIYSSFDGRDDFSWKEVLELVKNKPDIFDVNRDVKHKSYLDIDKRHLE